MSNKLIPIGNTSIALAKTSSALTITNKLTFNQNRKMVKEIFIKNPQFYTDYICKFYHELALVYNINFPYLSSTSRQFKTIRARYVSNEISQVLLMDLNFKYYNCIIVGTNIDNLKSFPNTINLKIENYKLFYKTKHYSLKTIYIDNAKKMKYRNEIDWSKLSLKKDSTIWIEEDIENKYSSRYENINLFECDGIIWNLKMLFDFVDYYDSMSFPNEDIWKILEPYIDYDLIEEVFEKVDLK